MRCVKDCIRTGLALHGGRSCVLDDVLLSLFLGGARRLLEEPGGLMYRVVVISVYSDGITHVNYSCASSR